MASGLRAALVLMLLLFSSGAAAALPGPTPSALIDAGCFENVCSWSLPSDSGPLTTAWSPFLDEVGPAAWTANASALTVEIVNATRAGMFMLSSVDVVPAPKNGSFSVWLRSSGDVTHFAVLLREVSPGAQSAATDTVFFAPAHEGWTFVSFPYERRLTNASEVRIALQGGIPEGGSGGIAFGAPRLSADTSQWYVGKETEPFAHGPYASYEFSSPATYEVRAVGAKTVKFTARIANVPPAVDLTLDLDATMRLRATATVTSPFHPNLVTNGEFRDDVAGWRLAPYELALADGAVAFDQGALRLSVPKANASGSLWATQEVAVTPGIPLEFTWRAHDDHGIASYALVILDNGTRHEASHPPGGPLGIAGRIAFTPASPRVEVQLRVIFAQGASGAVWFDAVDLHRAYKYRWTIDGRAFSADGPVTALAIGTPRNATVSVDVTDRFGAKTTATLNLTRKPTGIEEHMSLVATPQPRVATTGKSIPLAVAVAPLAPFNALGTNGPWFGWGAERSEAPGRAKVQFMNGTASVAVVAAGDEPGASGVERLILTPAPGVPYDLSFEYRTTSSATRVEALGRYHSPTDLVFEESHRNLPATDDWTPATVRTNPSQSRTLTLLGLRAIVPPGVDGGAEFRNVTYTPALTVAWSGAPPGGPVNEVTARKPGPVKWTAAATLHSGLSLSIRDAVYFTAPVNPFVTLSGVPSAVWNASNLPPDHTVKLEGPLNVGAPVGAGVLRAESLIPGDYRVLVVAPDGRATQIGEARLPALEGPSPTGDAWRATRGEPFDLEIELANPMIRNATLVLTSPSGRESTIPLAFNTSTQSWKAIWTTSPRNAAGDYDARLRVVDAEGIAAEIELDPLALTMAPGTRDGWVAFTIVLAATVLAVWMPRQRPRSAIPRVLGRTSIVVLDAASVFAVTHVIARLVLAPGPVDLEVGIFTVSTLAAIGCAVAAGFVATELSRGSMVRLGLAAASVAAILAIVVRVLHAIPPFAGVPLPLIAAAVVPWFGVLVVVRWLVARVEQVVEARSVSR